MSENLIAALIIFKGIQQSLDDAEILLKVDIRRVRFKGHYMHQQSPARNVLRSCFIVVAADVEKFACRRLVSSMQAASFFSVLKNSR